MFNEDNFFLAYKVCEALNSHETMVKFAEWEVALHATELAYLLEHAKAYQNLTHGETTYTTMKNTSCVPNC